MPNNLVPGARRSVADYFDERDVASTTRLPLFKRRAGGALSRRLMWDVWAQIASMRVAESPAIESLDEVREADGDPRGEWVFRNRIRLLLQNDDGSSVAVVLLREEKWIEANGIHVGGSCYLDMPDMGTTGWATVEAIDSRLVFCYFNNRGSSMITGTFRHSAGRAGYLKLKAEPGPIGVTPGHLFWSVDREDWVPACELRSGEAVKTLAGITTVESYTMGDRPVPVYNLEVEGDHVYRVGNRGTLVHNTSEPVKGKDYGCENKAGSGRLDPCERKKLRKKLGGCQTDYAAHHLIPCSVRETSALKQAAKLGFDINGALNGWCLPTCCKEAKTTKKPLHRGRHVSGAGDEPNYFVCVQSLLKSLDDARIRGEVTDCNLCSSVAKVIGKICTALKSHKIWLQKADPNKGAAWECPRVSFARGGKS